MGEGAFLAILLGATAGGCINILWVSSAALIGFAPPTYSQAFGIVGLSTILVPVAIGLLLLWEELRHG